jgi:hypothetical protein
MKIEPNQSVVTQITPNFVLRKSAQPMFKGGGLFRQIVKQEADNFMSLNRSKISTISLKNAAETILQRIGLKKDFSVPETKEKIIAEVFDSLQNEKEFFADYAKSGYKLPHIEKNANLVSTLERKDILKEQRAWDPPMFDQGHLTSNGYNRVRQSIIDAPDWKMSESEKIKALNDLARNNGHSGDIIYGNHLTFSGHSSVEETSGISEHVDDDTKESFWDAVLDFLDDIL